jgi:hypothetical protein
VHAQSRLDFDWSRLGSRIILTQTAGQHSHCMVQTTGRNSNRPEPIMGSNTVYVQTTGLGLIRILIGSDHGTGLLLVHTSGQDFDWSRPRERIPIGPDQCPDRILFLHTASLLGPCDLTKSYI